jgi:hypothetical protein
MSQNFGSQGNLHLRSSVPTMAYVGNGFGQPDCKEINSNTWGNAVGYCPRQWKIGFMTEYRGATKHIAFSRKRDLRSSYPACIGLESYQYLLSAFSTEQILLESSTRHNWSCWEDRSFVHVHMCKP